MKRIIFIMLLAFNNSFSQSWNEILIEKDSLFKNDNSYKIILEQQHAFANTNAPVIAGPII